MLLEILQCDIDTGVPCDCRRCAIARAYTRQTGHECAVGAFHISDGLIGREWLLSDDAVEWRRSFDRGDVVTPTILELLEERYAA